VCEWHVSDLCAPRQECGVDVAVGKFSSETLWETLRSFIAGQGCDPIGDPGITVLRHGSMYQEYSPGQTRPAPAQFKPRMYKGLS
jgi:hypothetical protein